MVKSRSDRDRRIGAILRRHRVSRLISARGERKGMGFTHPEPCETGRPPYNPGDKLKLFIYGYLNHMRSSRKLERE